MYTFLVVLLVAVAAALALHGARSRSVGWVVAGLALGAATWLGFTFMGFWGEVLWFDALGYEGRLWREVLWRLGAAAGGGLAAAVAAGALTWSARRRRVVWAAAIVGGAVIGVLWGLGTWETIALYANRAPSELAEPIFGRSVSFYLFTLPFYDELRTLAVWTALIGLVGGLAGLFVWAEDGPLEIRRPFGAGGRGGRRPPVGTASVFVSAAVLLGLWAWGQYLGRYHLMYSQWGAVSGPGWTDVHARIPGYWVTTVAMALLAVALLVPSLRRRIVERLGGDRLREAGLSGQVIPLAAIALAALAAAAVWLVALVLVPGLLQWLRVEPNEITFERPYIANNIEFTRHGFALDRVETREFPATGEFTPQIVRNNEDMFDNIRLWDYRALAQVYSQFQEIRLYYEFADVDIDRYTIDGRYRQVMVSARELELANLPSGSQTFVNRHFKYTHGFGITLTTVSDFTPEGLPDMIIKEIPPISTAETLQVRQPRIYYGELTDDYVIADSEEAEFDYPQGESNVYVHYDGTGGVLIGNLWRRFLYGWKFGGTRLLLSSYPRSESQILFRRNILRRAKALAPFLRFDHDPYVVLIDGKLYWILDAYTTSRRFPYSEPFNPRGMGDYGYGRQDVPPARDVAYLAGVNYMRNSVKAVVDAYNGDVTFYVMSPDDPIIRTWQAVFPDLFRPVDAMPPEVFAHVRYPSDFLLTQGIVYAKYHMTDPVVFYNLEDLWVRATEKYYQNVQAVEPYYVMWRPPETQALEYILMMPFTPKNKQVMIGWIAGMCDGENYGRFLAYRFPKERRVIGPQQVETKIDQDPNLSGQLTLWNQRGSRVIRGNVLAIPVGETMLYVEPIYIQAETAAYPELRLVVLMHNDRLAYAPTFSEALEILVRPGAEPATRPGAPAGVVEGAQAELIRRAQQAFDDYQRLTGQGRFRQASEALDRLQSALDQLAEQAGEARPQEEQPQLDDQPTSE